MGLDQLYNNRESSVYYDGEGWWGKAKKLKNHQSTELKTLFLLKFHEEFHCNYQILVLKTRGKINGGDGGVNEKGFWV